MAERRAPTVSIVTATFNRSRSLTLMIEAVRRQTLSEWELIVVGDACTDDTDAVVAAFDDERIRFVNLTRNFGEQAGPNNVGWASASAAYVAFCNHDVMWLPHHLRVACETLEAERADLVFGTAAIIGGDTPLPLSWPDLRIALDGVPVGRSWDPGLLNASTVSGSSMVIRRSLLERLNGWNLARDCASEPSQDLLFRAWRAGARIRGVGMLTSVTAPSGFRPGSYVGNSAPESEWIATQLDRPDFAAELLAMALETNDNFGRRQRRGPRPLVRHAARLLARCGVDPRAMWFRYGRRLRRGEYVAQLRRIRGLAGRPIGLDDAALVRYDESARACRIAVGDRVGCAAGAGGARYLAFGWSRPDAEGVWADGPRSGLLFEFASAPAADIVIEFQFRVFLGDGTARRHVVVAIGGRDAERLTLGDGVDWTHRLRVSRRDVAHRRLAVELTFANPESPKSLGLSDDERELSVGLIALSVQFA